FASPLSMKPGAGKRLSKTLNKELPELLFDEWIPLGSLATEYNPELPFDFAFSMKSLKARAPWNLEVEPAAPEQLITDLLPLTNLLRLPGAIDKMAKYLKPAACFRMAGGQLDERIEFVTELVGKETVATTVLT
ncbi:MAG: hypothetical protein ACRD3W_25275, partial [Terriglobales bacterium]